MLEMWLKLLLNLALHNRVSKLSDKWNTTVENQVLPWLLECTYSVLMRSSKRLIPRWLEELLMLLMLLMLWVWIPTEPTTVTANLLIWNQFWWPHCLRSESFVCLLTCHHRCAVLVEHEGGQLLCSVRQPMTLDIERSRHVNIDVHNGLGHHWLLIVHFQFAIWVT